MNVELRYLRALVAVVDSQTFTDAAIALGTSQAAISRSVAALERALGLRILQRTTRNVTPTPAGERIIEHARRVLDEVALLERAAQDHSGELRVSYAWSALGRRTVALQRKWEELHPAVRLIWVQSNAPTGGLANGGVDIAVVRRPLTDNRFATTMIGTEARYGALAKGDPLARRRFLRLSDFAGRTIAVDHRTGITTEDLWLGMDGPASVRLVQGVDEWLTLISTGQAVGMSSEATAAQNPRPGITYRPVRDAPPISVFLASWKDDPSVLVADFTRLAREAFIPDQPEL
ncbi:LysR family transcriptional regulator [Arthrobacter sp. Leaf337]|uniref:LysR family transcriptional regulator n=1 Tax=Arthrobacter sp. Leaf337 TaxID=1736342 RepID=UPI0006FDA49D|nr:LysR family transcriptional regulator [Arthrobacter sp. Leaf337]KQR62342.1 LysR family transcriptional regulator [Arthrobacter sp. Leaf337]